MEYPDIVVVGSLNADLVAGIHRFPNAGETVIGSDFKTYCGGKGANQAFAAGRLGAQVSMIGLVGDDAHGTAQIENLSSVGVNTDGVHCDKDQPTGTAIIGVESTGDNRIIIIPGANASLTPDKLSAFEDIIQNTKIVLLQLEIPMESVGAVIRMANNAESRVIVDPAPAAPLPDEWLDHIDYLTPNLSELCLLTGETIDPDCPMDRVIESARLLCTRGVPNVIVKLGARGALLVTQDKHHYWPAQPVNAVDTTAAGDCFNAAFAVALTQSRIEMQAGEFAVAAATCSVLKHGAQVSMPTKENIDKMFSSEKRDTRFD